MLLSLRLPRTANNNACQGLAPLDPLRVSPAHRFARLGETLRASIDHGPAPYGLSCRSSLSACLTHRRRRIIPGRRSPLPRPPLLYALRLPGARLMTEVGYATPYR